MNTDYYFSLIDDGIRLFNTEKGLALSKTPKSDWLVFDYRELSWKRDGLNCSIEIYPNFDNQEEIISWNLGAAIWYDTAKSRYCQSKSFAENIQLEYIATNIIPLLTEAYLYINSIKKQAIPFALKFKRY